ncbi:hypothetical protein CsSME_00052124 [Camellia sinensis var. sinensis]
MTYRFTFGPTPNLPHHVILPHVRPRFTAPFPYPVFSTSSYHVTRRLSSPALCHLPIRGQLSSWSVPPLGHPSWLALLMVCHSARPPFMVGPSTRRPSAVGPPLGQSPHSATLRGRLSSWSVTSLGHPSWSALLMVGPFTQRPSAVGPPLGRSLHLATLRGRPSSWSVPPLGHPPRSALLLVGHSARPPFVVGPPLGRSLHSATRRSRPSSWSVHPLGHSYRSTSILSVSNNPHFLHYSLRWTKAALGNEGLLT